jgi:hypothetical protein
VSELPLPDFDALPAEQVRRLVRACLGFERAWRAGPRPRLEDHLAEAGAAVRAPLLRELVLLDVYYRRRAGEWPGAADYRERFPELEPAWLARVLAEREGTDEGPPQGRSAAETPSRDERTPAGAAAGPRRVGDFQLQEEIGRGGMGVVYRARQAGLNRLVALKMILAGSHAGAAARARFRTEAEAVARLTHPNIVRVYQVGEHEGLPYLALEFCPDGSLGQALSRGPLPPAEAAALVEILAGAVQAAHDKGVLHRDLKPANVLFAEDGTPRLSDFGLAKLCDARGPTAEGAALGTPSYMAPELAEGRGGEAGPACDVYSLGAILYECLTGRPPFLAASPEDTLRQVLRDEAVPPSRLNSVVPPALEAICLRCLHKDPARRYARAAGLAEALRAWRAGTATPAPRATGWRWRWAALLAVAVLVGAGLWRAWPRPLAPAAAAPLQGFVDLQIVDPHDPARQDRWLGESGVLPLRAGDQFCIRADLNRPAYLYVVWIDADGKAELAYPRDPMTKRRAAAERPVQTLRRPEALDKFYEIPEASGLPLLIAGRVGLGAAPLGTGPLSEVAALGATAEALAGTETVVLLAREEPLPADVDLAAELGGLPPQRRRGEAVVWFRDGEVVRDDPQRMPTWDEHGVDDPLRQTQERLRQVWQRHGGLLRAVSFASQGQ